MKKLILKNIFQEDEFLTKTNINDKNNYELDLISKEVTIELDDIVLNDYLKDIFKINNEIKMPIPTNKLLFKLNNDLAKKAIWFENSLKEKKSIKFDYDFDTLISIFITALIFKLDLLLNFFISDIIYENYNLKTIYYWFILCWYYNNYHEILIELYFIISYFWKYQYKYKLSEKIELNIVNENLKLILEDCEVILNYSKFKENIKNCYKSYIKNKFYSVSENFEITYNNKIKANNLEFQMVNYNGDVIFESIIIDKFYRIFKSKKSNTLLSDKYLGLVYYSISGLKYYFYNKFFKFDCFEIWGNKHKNDYRINRVRFEATAFNDRARFFKLYIYNLENPDKFLNLRTKIPIYNYDREIYELNLYKQSKEASAKNFELIDNIGKCKNEDDLDIYYIHCKQETGKFIIHFRDPLNFIQSFFISIASNIKKKLE